MSTIQKAMGQLFASLDRLEQAAGRQEQKTAKVRQKEQTDLFAGIAAAYVVDPAIVSKKLDGAIEKIEKLLREG